MELLYRMAKHQITFNVHTIMSLQGSFKETTKLVELSAFLKCLIDSIHLSVSFTDITYIHTYLSVSDHMDPYKNTNRDRHQNIVFICFYTVSGKNAPLNMSK